MPENDKFFSVNIREYLALGNDEEAGEPAHAELLSGFSCIIGNSSCRRNLEIK